MTFLFSVVYNTVKLQGTLMTPCSVLKFTYNCSSGALLSQHLHMNSFFENILRIMYHFSPSMCMTDGATCKILNVLLYLMMTSGAPVKWTSLPDISQRCTASFQKSYWLSCQKSQNVINVVVFSFCMAQGYTQMGTCDEVGRTRSMF